MKKSRALYLHPETNEGKIHALEALQVEYHRYLQACIDRMISSKRMTVSKKELLSFFPKEKMLSSNLVLACQQHAVEVMSGWSASLYTKKLKPKIKQLYRDGEVSEPIKIALFTIGKYRVDHPTETIPQEALDLYWILLLKASKPPTVSNRVGIRLSIHTSDIRKLEETKVSQWWLGFSNLKKGRKIQVPIVENPHVKSPDEIVNGCMIRKDRRGRWRVEVLEKKLIANPKFDPKSPRVGVDVGLNVIAATSDGNLYGADFKPRFDKTYKTTRDLRANRQRQGLRENSPRLDRLESKLSGMIKTATGTVANRLVKAHPNTTFVIEDLDLRGSRGQKRFAYRALHHSLSTKASVESVNPAYTSQMCPSCGSVSRSNRSGIKFHCRSCGRKSHADVVGAQNLLGRSEDKQILGCEHPSEVKALLRERYLRKRNSFSGKSEVNELEWPNRKLTVEVSRKRDISTASNAGNSQYANY